MRIKTTFIMFALSCAATNAQVRLSPLFTDNMVMQQRTDAPIWGTCEAGRTVSVTTSWNKRKYDTVAGNDGKWKVKVATPKAGGPYEITVSDGTPVTLRNVMIGEVWLCSGQSNMDMPVNGWGQVNNYEAEVKAAGHPDIRLLRVDNVMAMQPQQSFTAMNGGWQVCSPEVIAPFSAVAYFFGRDIEKYRDVPVGLIQSSWGGTPAEAWTSGESLTEMPEFRGEVERIGSMPDNKEERAAIYKDELAGWFNKLNGNDPEFKDGRFAYFAASYDDSGWDDTPVPGYITDSKYGAFDGMIIYRRVVDIPGNIAGKRLTLCLGKVDDDDMTFFNDVMIGSTTGPGETREYTIPAGAVKAGKAVITVRSIDTGRHNDKSQRNMEDTDGGSSELALLQAARPRERPEERMRALQRDDKSARGICHQGCHMVSGRGQLQPCVAVPRPHAAHDRGLEAEVGLRLPVLHGAARQLHAASRPAHRIALGRAARGSADDCRQTLRVRNGVHNRHRGGWRHPSAQQAGRGAQARAAGTAESVW